MDNQLEKQSDKRIAVSIKGVKDGLLISLGDGEWAEAFDHLLQYVDEQENFFQGARVALDVNNRVIHAADMGTLRDKLSDRGVSLWAVISHSSATEETAKMLGLATKLPTVRPEREIRTMNTNLPGESAVLVQRTLRSGFRISHPGHVVVIGDVNPGAEIVAGGSVIVWGKLRGLVHAGVEGDEQAQVCALDLAPTQLRIAGIVAVPPQRKKKMQPEVARIVDGQVVAEPWDNK